jgi:tRNA(His) 5'-end guanylyltransferase
MSTRDSLGDRMKMYESSNQRVLIPRLPVLCRLDGRCFHTFTRGLERPFDENMHRLMVETAAELLAESNAAIAYTQSDEITLAWWQPGPESEAYFDGRVDKTNSILAATASVAFNRLLRTFLPDKADRRPVFDCRTWNVPTPDEACNAILWRENDATRNSVSMAAQSMFSHKQLQGKSRSQMMDMMMEKGVNWNDYPSWCKRGSYLRREPTKIDLTPEQIEAMPKRQREQLGRRNFYVRHRIVEVDLPPFSKIANKVDVIFFGNAAESVVGNALQVE